MSTFIGSFFKKLEIHNREEIFFKIDHVSRRDVVCRQCKKNLTTAALANTTGRAKAEMTTPVVRKVQNSLRAEEVERSSVWRRANRVGRGAKR